MTQRTTEQSLRAEQANDDEASGPVKKRRKRKAKKAAKKEEALKIKVEPSKEEASSEQEKSSPTQEEIADIIDRSIHATIAHFTKGLSPGTLSNAYWDWASHLMINQGKQMQLAQMAMDNWTTLYNNFWQAGIWNQPNGDASDVKDKRFRHEAWQRYPFNLYYQSFLLGQDWWKHATSDVRGVSKKHEKVVDFMARQILDMFSPSNFMHMNPEILDKTREEGGANLVRGLNNFLEDWTNMNNGEGPYGSEKFKVGENLAATKGKVIFQNRLFELIQYEPTTKRVRPEPILVVPAWIMKYYILDLSQYNSVVKHLVDQGFSVFIISWKNPGSEDRDVGMQHYLEEGIETALNVVNQVVPNRKVHAVGYCLGGTLLSIYAAYLAREQQEKFKSLTFLAAQVDFKEAGELTLFIDDSQLTFLEDMMWEQGYLDAQQMAGAFQLLRTNDLIWSRILHDYFMGQRQGMNDIMAWNADPTRMPFRMHAEYLRWLFLRNDLAEGRYKVDDKNISLSDIHEPIFAVGTQKDHVAPWRSVYKFHNLVNTDITFLLTNGGHNAGIVSEPGHRGRRYQVATHKPDDKFIDPERWAAETEFTEGSWWPEWVKWLKKRSGNLVNPPKMGGTSFTPICDAPGEYVYIK